MDPYRKHVKSDCQELLSRFRRTESVRFETFCHIWREMKFSDIFCGIENRKRGTFSQLILNTASSFFLPPFSFQIRVGGLYLLYSLYRCQTATPPVQIRLALKDWEDVQKFQKDAMDAQHLDVVYVLRQLLSYKAFYFTAMPTLLSYRKKRKSEKWALCEDFMERPSRPQELIGVELLEELSNIHELYKKMKTSVFTSSEQAASSLNLVRNDPVPELRGAVMDFHKWQNRTGASDEERDGGEGDGDGGEGTSSLEESSSRAKLLASIKSKAYGQASEACRSRRHRQVEVDLTSNEAGPSPSTGHPRTHKLSLKARTNQNVHLSGDVWKEVKSMTQISRLTALDFVPNENPRTNKPVEETKRKT